jgi:hypothetical protein
MKDYTLEAVTGKTVLRIHIEGDGLAVMSWTDDRGKREHLVIDRSDASKLRDWITAWLVPMRVVK